MISVVLSPRTPPECSHVSGQLSADAMSPREQQLLNRLIEKPSEDNFIERKPASVKSHELRQTLVAFSNSLPLSETGLLFIGVHDRTGEILGVSDTETDAIQRRVGEAGEDCYPPIRPTMSVLDVDGKRVIAVEIAASRDKPHFAGPAYVRSGSRSVKASESLYRDLLTSHCSKAGELLRWKDKKVTVRLIHKRLGNRYPDWDPSIDRVHECIITRCDPFSVTFDLLGYGQYCTEPLERIELDWDSINERRTVIVRGTPPARLR